jgi:AraC-like DNA-binding protein
MADDSFSDILRFMRARILHSSGLIAGGSWAVSFPRSTRIKFWGVAKGICWLTQGDAPPIRIETGDVLLCNGGPPLVFGSDPAVTPVDIAAVARNRTGAIVRHNDGDDFFLLGGQVALEADCEALLFEALPPFIHVPSGSPQSAVLHWLIDQLVRESDGGLLGADAVMEQLAHLMFIQILRAHLGVADGIAPGWLRAVADRRLAPALRLMHAEPSRSWQLGELARSTGMSRAAFAAYFKIVAGTTPMAYLTEWRMRLAKRALRDGSTPLRPLAQSLGYASESAFSNAFKRVTGTAPRTYRDAMPG